MKNPILSLFAGSALALGTMSCSDPSRSQMVYPDTGSHADAPTGTSCTEGLPQYKLGVHVASFEVTDVGGFQLGFPASQILNPVVDLEIEIKSGRMTLEVDAVDPLETGLVLRSAQGKSTLTAFNLSTKINLPQLQLDITGHYAMQTGLAEVATKALQDGLNNVGAATAQLAWTSQILGTWEGYAIIDAGSLAGVQAGDQFEIHNRRFVWSGAPCASKFLGAFVDSNVAAVVEVVDTDPTSGGADGTSFARVLSGDIRDVAENALVSVSRLKAGPGPRVLKKAVKPGDIVAENIQIPNGGSFSLKGAMDALLPGLIVNSGYWLKP